MYQLECQVCKAIFESKRKNKKTCSTECHKIIRLGSYKKSYDFEDLREHVASSHTIAEVLRKLTLAPRGANYFTIKRHVQRLGLDTSHWTGQAWSKDKQLKNWNDYNRSSSLKPILLRERGRRCENCMLNEWLGEPITIEMDHIDGDRTNNDPNNLRLLCPNCHSLTPTWKGKKRKLIGRSN